MSEYYDFPIDYTGWENSIYGSGLYDNMPNMADYYSPQPVVAPDWWSNVASPAEESSGWFSDLAGSVGGGLSKAAASPSFWNLLGLGAGVASKAMGGGETKTTSQQTSSPALTPGAQAGASSLQQLLPFLEQQVATPQVSPEMLNLYSQLFGPGMESMLGAPAEGREAYNQALALYNPEAMQAQLQQALQEGFKTAGPWGFTKGGTLPAATEYAMNKAMLPMMQQQSGLYQGLANYLGTEPSRQLQSYAGLMGLSEDPYTAARNTALQQLLGVAQPLMGLPSGSAGTGVTTAGTGSRFADILGALGQGASTTGTNMTNQSKLDALMRLLG